MNQVELLDIGYKFKDIKLLKNAFIHKSYSYEKQNKIKNNERLEFLGDAVLELSVSEYLFKNYPKLAEGEMTRIRAAVVCEKSLYKIAVKHGFSEYLVVGKCEDKGHVGSTKPSILADSVEAVIGAIYLDGGFEVAKKFILDNLQKDIDDSVKGLGIKDYKTILQEVLQQNPVCNISYVVEKETGPEHDKMFHVNVYFNNKLLGKGIGKSKKEAEQNAAKKALGMMENEK